jgi:alpha-D-xyloside xylohydrolase
VESPAPYDSLPLHVRAGSIVPFGPSRQHAFDGPDDPLTLTVYEGRDGAFALYDDDGLTNAYETGAWTRVPITWRDADRTLTLGPRAGGFAGAPGERTFEVVFVGPGRAVPYGAGHGALVRYEGREIVVRP